MYTGFTSHKLENAYGLCLKGKIFTCDSDKFITALYANFNCTGAPVNITEKPFMQCESNNDGTSIKKENCCGECMYISTTTYPESTPTPTDNAYGIAMGLLHIIVAITTLYST
eukprot:412099_1